MDNATPGSEERRLKRLEEALLVAQANPPLTPPRRGTGQPVSLPSLEGLGVGSSSQCVRKNESQLSMNLTWERWRPAGVSNSQNHQPAGETPPLPGSWSQCTASKSW